MTHWRNLYLCEPWYDRDVVYLRLRELVLSYLNETEDYDQRVCSARRGKMAVSANGKERRLITQHAHACLSRHLEVARRERLLDTYSWTKVRQQVEREWEHDYIALDKRAEVCRVRA